MSELSKREQVIYDEMLKLHAQGKHTSVRGLADRLETTRHGAKMYSYDQIYRGVGALVKKGYARRIEPVVEAGKKKGPIRFEPTPPSPDAGVHLPE